RAAIPVFFARGTTRPDPAGRALLALLACKTERLSARRFAEYVSLAQVPDPGAAEDADARWTPPEDDLLPLPPATEPRADDERGDGSPRAPWRWERLLVEASVIGGKIGRASCRERVWCTEVSGVGSMMTGDWTE